MDATTVAQLPKVVKTFNTTFIDGPDSGRTRRECWSATTVDGVWSIDRIEDVGTPWTITLMSTGEQVGLYGTLKAARLAIASGCAATELEDSRVLAAARPLRSPSLFDQAEAVWRLSETLVGSTRATRQIVRKAIMAADIALYHERNRNQG